MTVRADTQRWVSPDGSWLSYVVSRHARTILAWSLLVVVMGLTAILSDTFRSAPVVLETVKGSTFIGMAAAAETFVVLGGGIDLSIGSVAALSAMAAAVVMNGHDHSIGLAVAASLAVGLVVGSVNGLLVTRLRVSPFVATFGMLYVLQGLAYTYSVSPVGEAAPTFYSIYVATVAGVPVLLLIMAAFWAICWYIARRTAFGKHLYAVGGDTEAARLAGVRTGRVTFASYVLCSVIAALAGLLELTQTSVGAADLGATLLLTTITAVVIGGVSLFGGEGSLIGTLGGALLLGFLKQFFDSVQVNAFYQQLVQGLIILALLGVYRQRAKT